MKRRKKKEEEEELEEEEEEEKELFLFNLESNMKPLKGIGGGSGADLGKRLKESFIF